MLVSRGRNKRPWTGQTEVASGDTLAPSYDHSCVLCPGNKRINGEHNPRYTGVYVFDNDFPALSLKGDNDGDAAGAGGRRDLHSLFRANLEHGTCRVVCFSEDHSATLARMNSGQITPVIQSCADQTDDLLHVRNINHVQIFENHGETMGCSNPHPHGQVWAQQNVPSVPAREQRAMRQYHTQHRSLLLLDYLSEERTRAKRIVCANESFAVLVPFWAAWPFETLLIPTRPMSLLTQLRDDEIEALADIVRRVTVRYDNLFRTDFPYSSGIHQMLGQTESSDGFQLHMHFFPPLLRSESVRKFMVGYEMLAETQREFSPERAAAVLRNQSENHFLMQSLSDGRLSARDGARVPHGS